MASKQGVALCGLANKSAPLDARNCIAGLSVEGFQSQSEPLEFEPLHSGYQAYKLGVYGPEASSKVWGPNAMAFIIVVLY